MADVAYNVAKLELMQGTLDLHTTGADFAVLLLESATDENVDDTTISAVLARAGTTELTSTGYSAGGASLVGEAVTQDDTNDRAEFDGNDLTFSGLDQAGSETIVAAVGYEERGATTVDLPIVFWDAMTGMPLTPNGSDVTITWDAQGILQLT